MLTKPRRKKPTLINVNHILLRVVPVLLSLWRPTHRHAVDSIIEKFNHENKYLETFSVKTFAL